MLIAVVSNLFAVLHHVTFRGDSKEEISIIVICKCDMTLPTDHKVFLVLPDLMAVVGWRGGKVKAVVLS